MTGISLPTIKRLGRAEITHPSVRMLANCARVLNAFAGHGTTVQLEDLVEDSWRDWYVFDASKAANPPARWRHSSGPANA